MTMMYAMGQMAVRIPRNPDPATAVPGIPNATNTTTISATTAMLAARMPFILSAVRQTRKIAMGITATSAEIHGFPNGSVSCVHNS